MNEGREGGGRETERRRIQRDMSGKWQRQMRSEKGGAVIAEDGGKLWLIQVNKKQIEGKPWRTQFNLWDGERNNATGVGVDGDDGGVGPGQQQTTDEMATACHSRERGGRTQMEFKLINLT